MRTFAVQFFGMEIKKLSIIIPVYNEEPTIHLILDKINAVTVLDGIEKEFSSVRIRTLDFRQIVATLGLNDFTEKFPTTY